MERIIEVWTHGELDRYRIELRANEDETKFGYAIYYLPEGEHTQEKQSVLLVYDDPYTAFFFAGMEVKSYTD